VSENPNYDYDYGQGAEPGGGYDDQAYEGGYEQGEPGLEDLQSQLDQLRQARGLLEERAQSARIIAAKLTASVHETVRLARAYLSERTAQDALVAAVPGATPRNDGPPATHPWEAQLKALERAVVEVAEVPAPSPRWRGLEFRRQEDSTARRLQLQRRKKLTADEQAELEWLDQDRGPAAAVAMASEQ
jgi:hypothetical protein